ncbi:MAG: class 1 fructose-bisphosphatase [Candidatus Brocadiaceae bacterium]|nr:class 1 fructose-bisphosphatase [Candidatus Brocadiaceae bacterium]
MSNRKIVTVQRHIVEQEKEHPEATGTFTSLLWDLTIAAKIISREVNMAGLANILGLTGKKNVHGEAVKKLDIYSNEVIIHAMDHGGHLCAMASEENEEFIPIPNKHPKGNYVLMFDPLDGSSNIDANVSVGTIFSIYRKKTPGVEGALEDCLRKGMEQVAAGYIVYGSSTMLVYTTGHGVHGFTLDPGIGEFLLSHENIQIPSRGKTYSINEGNTNTWDENTRKYISYLKEKDAATGRPYSLRYIGSLVADFHRNLLYGGIFLYPKDYKDQAKPKAKLRLLYEAAPLAFIVEQAGGKASTGTERILDIEAKELHQKVPLIIGSKEDVEMYETFLQKS